MTYYHVSVLASRKFIYPWAADLVGKEIIPCIPEDCDWEDQETKRVSIAPAVWGCLLSKLTAVPVVFHIYEMNLESATDPKGGPSDYAETREKWLTDDDVKKLGGRIELTYLGFIRADGELHEKLDTLKKQGELPGPPASEDNLWEKHLGEWSLAINPWW